MTLSTAKYLNMCDKAFELHNCGFREYLPTLEEIIELLNTTNFEFTIFNTPQLCLDSGKDKLTLEIDDGTGDTEEYLYGSNFEELFLQYLMYQKYNKRWIKNEWKAKHK